MINAVVL